MVSVIIASVVGVALGAYAQYKTNFIGRAKKVEQVAVQDFDKLKQDSANDAHKILRLLIDLADRVKALEDAAKKL